jgi:hypothetical protein
MNQYSKTFAIFLMVLFSLITPGLHAQWTQTGADINGESGDDHAVSLSADGSIIAIGARFNAGGGTERGRVRVYKKTGSNWIQLGANIDGEADNDFSGYSLSLSADGTTVAIGAYLNAGGGVARGHVRVYKLTGSIWTKIGADIDGEADYDNSGWSVSLSADGKTVAIGAIANSGTLHGYVRVYKNIWGTWTQQGGDIDGETDGDAAGWSVSLSVDGTIVAIGAPYNESGGGINRGHVRVYKIINGTWIQQGTDIQGEADDDISGYSVSLSAEGTWVAIGAYVNDGGGINSGHVRVFRNISGIWTQQGADIDGEAIGDRSGYTVSLSADGKTVAIGAVNNDGCGLNCGHVRVYKKTGDGWIQQGGDIDGEAPGDVSGYSVSLSADGSAVAIGSSNNVRVYSFCNQTQKFLNAMLAIAKQKGKKVYVCRQGIYTLQVSASDFYYYLFQGYKLGKCGTNYCDGLIELRGNELDNIIGTEDDKSGIERMILYPNPAGHILNVKLPFHSDGTVQIKVINSLGQLVKSEQIKAASFDRSQYALDIKSIPEGYYTLSFSSQEFKEVKPFYKLK